MRILAFTDHHGDAHALAKVKKKSKKADLILCGGDITIFENHLKRIVRELNGLGKKVLLIHGNHEDERTLRKECEHHRNLTFLHKKFYEQDDVLFVGYGGGGFAPRDGEFEEFSKKIKTRHKKGQKLVVILHGPPHGTKVDIVMGDHVGSKSYANFIRKQKPDLVICGHIHDCNHRHDMIGKSIVVNPGPDGKMMDL
ncbi:metallophosphoesterase [Candidatus Woesearchaeota archaeon]|nr:metallophosphoesterase [Candidatus Woesearchaeota archaeon]